MLQTFADILDIYHGKNQKKVENPNGKYPIYGSGGIMGYADDYLCPENTVVIGRKGTINKPIYVEEPFWNVDTAFGLVARKDILNPKYLYYFCKQFDFEKLNTTVTIPSLTKANLLGITLEVPEIDKQIEVAATLDQMNQIIRMRQKELEELDKLIESRFVEMFGDSVHNDKGWKTSTVEDACDEIYGGGTPSKSHPEYYEDGDIPWVSSKDMKTDVLYDSQIHINQFGVDNSTARMVPANSVIMVIRSGILKHTLPVAINAVPITVNQDLKVFIPNKNILTRFLAVQFKMHEKDILSGVRVVTADNIEFNSLKQREIIVPPLELQQQFLDFTEQTDKLKLAIQRSLDETQTLMDSLMQEYFVLQLPSNLPQ
ncbi:MAG: restriction endonuclease subunit S [Eubacterium sp.]|nr:restriction endonuclease subunit S [Eubacterium sp.]